MTHVESFINEKNNRPQIVPWFGKSEWLETYHQVYSEDVELQEKAYTKMCIWKTRYPNLPLGVECTMSILHVKLCDRQTEGNTTTPVYKERDLQLLYSTAVMRFLNHLSVMSSCRDSMYKMAEQHQIPDWLINLRHEAAHGSSVPALYLLRQASDIILQWLRDYYWEEEAEVMTDVVINQEDEMEIRCKSVTELLELWMVLKMHYWAGLKTIDRIPNEEVRKRAMELANKEGVGIKIEVHGGSNKDCNGGEDIVMEEEDTEEYTHKIKTAFDPLVRRLFKPLKGKFQKRLPYKKQLIDCLVTYEGFCPLIDLDQLTETEILQTMSLLGDLWKEVIESLQTHDLLPVLLKALISRESELPSAHLWLGLLTKLLSGESPPHPQGTESLCQLIAVKLPCDVQSEVLLHKANLHYLKHHRPLNLKSPSAKEIEVLQEFAHKILYNPTRFSCTYLICLLGFWETPLSIQTREKLWVLARIYNGRRPHARTPAKVYTVASLLDHGVTINQLEESLVDDVTVMLTTSPWKQYSGDADWSRCALGALPWQT